MGYTNPANAAMPYLNQIPGTITPYYQKYIDAGSQSLTDLIGQYHTLLTNPDAIIQMAGSGYQQSPGYQYQYNQDMNAANSAAAAGGMLGTPYEQQDAASMANNLANQDYEQYLNQALGLYGNGLTGEQGLNEMGYKASDSLASGLATNLNNESGLAYNGQVNQNQHDAAFWNSLISGGTMALGATLGGIAGGPAGAAGGAAAGAKIGAAAGNNPGNTSATQMQGYEGNNGMVGPGGTQQDLMQMIGQKLKSLFQGSGNGVNSGAMMGGGY